MNSFAKIVFSSTLDKAEWHNSTLVDDNVAEVAPGKDMAIFGSPTFTASLREISATRQLSEQPRGPRPG